MFADHLLWLDHMGLFKDYSNRQVSADRANRFWLCSVGTNLMRDIYELVCIVQEKSIRNKDSLDSELRNFKFSTPIKRIRSNPKLSCDLIKNSCDFWTPYTAVNSIHLHPSIIGLLGIVSTRMGILQVYDRECRLSPSWHHTGVTKIERNIYKQGLLAEE